MQRKTWTSLLAAAALSSVLAGPAAAVTQMVAGWDFSQYSNDGFLSVNGSDLEGGDLLDANYSDLDPNGAGIESEARGRMYLNGQFGSTDTPLDFNDPFIPSEALPGGSLLSNVGAPASLDFGSTAAFNILDNENSQDFFGNFAMTAVSAATVVFSGNALNASDWVLTFGARTFTGATTIGVEFSTDGVIFNSFGVANLSSVDTPFSFAFGASDSDLAFVRLSFSGVGGQAFLDNVALIADVPEPGTVLLLVTGLTGLVAIGRRRA